MEYLRNIAIEHTLGRQPESGEILYINEASVSRKVNSLMQCNATMTRQEMLNFLDFSDRIDAIKFNVDMQNIYKRK